MAAWHTPSLSLLAVHTSPFAHNVVAAAVAPYLQGYVELLDNRPPAIGIDFAGRVDAPTGLSPLSEPAGSLQLLVDAS